MKKIIIISLLLSMASCSAKYTQCEQRTVAYKESIECSEDKVKVLHECINLKNYKGSDKEIIE